jgi:hypothetical protein
VRYEICARYRPVCFLTWDILRGISSASIPHGGVDAYGCHNNGKAGGYHCFRGQCAGQSFAPQAKMLKKLSTEKSDKDTKINAGH